MYETSCPLLTILLMSFIYFSVNGFSALVAIVLITIQVWHRLYETRCVSVFSNARINLTHYIVGYFHYFGSVTAILCESQGFVKQGKFQKMKPLFLDCYPHPHCYKHLIFTLDFA